MSFDTILQKWPRARVLELIEKTTSEDLARAIRTSEPTERDLGAMLSPVAEGFLEPMAKRAKALTRQFFGRTISLYAPLYLSNICEAGCTYCNYSASLKHSRTPLVLDEAMLRTEAAALAKSGIRSVLLLTGESRSATSPEYIAKSVAIAREYFTSVAVEVYSLSKDEYALLVEHGLEGVTLYMETYDRERFKVVHPRGEKSDYDFRLEASRRAGEAGARRLGVGALLGLSHWRVDAFHTALHAMYLERKCWQSAISVSFPRLSNVPEAFEIADRPNDYEFTQLILAMRLFLPRAGLVLSTRESARLRNGLLGLGITTLSAGSKTSPGGYAGDGNSQDEQFAIDDERSVAQVADAIRQRGYDPVWKDFDDAFIS